MRIAINTRELGDVTIMDLRGRLIVGEESAALRLQVRDLLLQGKNKLLLNLGQVDYIDSSGLGDIVGAFLSARKHGGEVKLLTPENKFQDLLRMTKLHLFFDIKDNEVSAVESFHQPTTATV